MPEPGRPSPPLDRSTHVDPRVARTKFHVLAVARAMLAEHGPSSLTYSSLCHASGVTRQTLYRHWPALPLLLRDIVIAHPDTPIAEPGTDAVAEIVDFLATMRDGMSNPATAAALLTLASFAPHQPACAEALVALIDTRRSYLNIKLSGTPYQLDVDEFSELAGPVIFKAAIARADVSDDFIRSNVDRWLRSQEPQDLVRQGGAPDLPAHGVVGKSRASHRNGGPPGTAEAAG